MLTNDQTLHDEISFVKVVIMYFTLFQDKEEKYRKKYVCGPDGKPIIGPDGHRIRLKQPKHEKQDADGEE